MGHPIDDNQNSMTSGENGPILIQDFHFFDKISKFDRERIPERVVHAKGSGAHGYFEVTHDVTKFCKADIFKNIGSKTPCFVRLSTVTGEKASPDSDRDPRGFSIKFYTKEGIWDIVNNDFPVFFIRDPIKFPDIIHAFKRDPETGLKNVNNFWDFLSLTPESVHATLMLFSDRGTPFSFRHIHGFGNHTFRWVNDQNEAVFVKYHFITNQGIKNFTFEESLKMRLVDPDFARRDLRESIDSGNFPSWNFMIQVMPEKDAEKYHINILDVTKVWPHGDYPLIPAGRLVLDRNPSNFFAEVEQVGFAPSRMPPGVEPSFDKMLQGRLYSYDDTQRHRLGGNFDQIPINCPFRARVSASDRDGFMRVNGNYGAKGHYEPNSVMPFTFSEKAKISSLPVRGHVGRFKPSHPNDDFAQGGVFYRKVMSEQDRINLAHNIAVDLGKAKRTIQERELRLLFKSDPDLGSRVASQMGVPATPPKM